MAYQIFKSDRPLNFNINTSYELVKYVYFAVPKTSFAISTT